MKINPKFICDEKGKRKVAIITMRQFEKLADKLEDYYDYLAVRKIKKQKITKFYTLDEIMREFTRD